MPESSSSDTGYDYYLSDEAIRKYMEWPIAARLTWLEEANRFLDRVLTPEARKIRNTLRMG
ncbi:MAG TPA: hypothetical protein VIU33_04700 [Nitrospiria bacterium]